MRRDRGIAGRNAGHDTLIFAESQLYGPELEASSMGIADGVIG